MDLALDKCFDRVHHDKLLNLVKGRIAARRVLQRLERYRKAGVLTGDGFEATGEGPPQGGPRSPLVANLLLDCLAKEWERRGHRFVRYADESNIYVKSLQAGQRVRARVTRFLERRLTRTVKAVKRAVDRPWRRTFLGVTGMRRRPHRRQGSANAFKALTQEVGQRTGRTRGVALQRVVDGVRQSLDGWYASWGSPEGPARFKELDSWVRRRLRCYV